MVEAIIDLRDRKNPPPDDPDAAPYGYRWDTGKKEWVAKRSAGGRKSGAAWWGKNLVGNGESPENHEDSFTSKVTDYFRDEPGDPEPAHMKSTAPRIPKSQPRVSKKTKDDMTAAVGLVGMLVLPPVVKVDPYCGQALADSMQPIADALVPLLCKSSTVVAFFSDAPGSDWMLWFKLAMALAPVATAVGRHHLLKTVEIQEDKDTGELYAVPRDLSEYATESA